MEGICLLTDLVILLVIFFGIFCLFFFILAFWKLWRRGVLKLDFSFYRDDDDINHGHPKYDKWEPRAKTIKICAQMVIGAMLVLLLVTKFLFHLINCPYPSCLSYIQAIHSLKTLEIVSFALAYSAGVELAYMLYTPGPDEAIEPLIIGAAATLLCTISQTESLNVQTVTSILLLVFAIAGLFLLKEFFIEDKKDDKKRLIDLIRQKANRADATKGNDV